MDNLKKNIFTRLRTTTIGCFILASLLLGSLVHASEFDCKTNDGRYVNIFTLINSGGLDYRSSMKNSIGERIYGEYMKFTDKASQLYPNLGRQLKRLTRQRWIPLYQFNCKSIAWKSDNKIHGIDGFSKLIVYNSITPELSEFYIVEDLGSTKFDYKFDGESKDKMRILALINEALRLYFKESGNSVRISNSAIAIYNLVTKDLSESEIVKERSAANRQFPGDLLFTRQDVATLADNVDKLYEIARKFSVNIPHLKSELIKICKSKLGFFTSLDEEAIWFRKSWFNEIQYEKGVFECREKGTDDMKSEERAKLKRVLIPPEEVSQIYEFFSKFSLDLDKIEEDLTVLKESSYDIRVRDNNVFQSPIRRPEFSFEIRFEKEDYNEGIYIEEKWYNKQLESYANEIELYKSKITKLVKD